MLKSRGLLWGALALSALAAPALAAILSGTANLAIPGVDSLGNPNPKAATVVSGKFYKDSVTRIIVGYGYGIVQNASKQPASFSNQGLTVTDPWTNANIQSTSDTEIVTKPVLGYSGAALVIIYNPFNFLLH